MTLHPRTVISAGAIRSVPRSEPFSLRSSGGSGRSSIFGGIGFGQSAARTGAAAMPTRPSKVAAHDQRPTWRRIVI
jgi:hypothetical protein